MCKLVAEGQEVGVTGEVTHFFAPVRHGVADALDELPDARLPLRRAQMAAEILGGDNIRSELGPGFGDIDIVLLEDYVALLACDYGRALVPLYGIPDVLPRL